MTRAMRSGTPPMPKLGMTWTTWRWARVGSAAGAGLAAPAVKRGNRIDGHTGRVAALGRGPAPTCWRLPSVLLLSFPLLRPDRLPLFQAKERMFGIFGSRRRRSLVPSAAEAAAAR